MLNLPLNLFDKSQNILLAGIGGGFDCFASVPLYDTLTKMGKNCFFSSFKLEIGGRGVITLKEKMHHGYDPEGLLVDALHVPVMVLPKMTPKPLAEAYESVFKEYNIDHVVMVDGGVDSLMQGDEVRKGTIAEEFVNFSALSMFPSMPKTLVNLGFGCEREEEISHYRVLENMARLVKAGAFKGTCALTPQSEAFKKYRETYNIVEKYPEHKRSHIHPRIIAAVEGKFGELAIANNTIMQETKSVLISPLMSVMWFFDANYVISMNPIIPALRKCNTFLEVIMMLRDAPQERDNRVIPY